MTSEYLGGRVRKHVLPLLKTPTAPDAPELKRLDLAQGRLAQLTPSGQAFRYLAWVELIEGATRGNHYHHRKEEWFYLIEGEVDLLVEDPESKARATVRLREGDLAIITTGIAHAMLPVQAGQAIEFSPAEFDPQDTVRYSLVP